MEDTSQEKWNPPPSKFRLGAFASLALGSRFPGGLEHAGQGYRIAISNLRDLPPDEVRSCFAAGGG